MKRIILRSVLLLFLVGQFPAASLANTATVTASQNTRMLANSAKRNFPSPFRAAKRWVKRLLGMNGYVCILQYANVDNLYLSQTEIAWEAENDRGDQSTPRLIEVSTAASDPEGDVLTYNYEVSAGKIVGQGKKVVWDLTGVRPGTYLITAGVNDGCGICGMTKTRRVEIYLPGTQPLRETD